MRRRVLSALALAAALGLLVRTGWAGRHHLADALADPHWPALAGMLASAAAAMVWIAAQWRAVLRLLGAAVPGDAALAAYFAGEIGKYLPGGIWPVVGRAELITRRAGGPARALAYASVLLSLAYLMLAGLLFATGAAGLAWAGEIGSPAPLALLALLPAGVAGLHPQVLDRLAALAARVLKRAPFAGMTMPSWRRSTVMVVRYVPAWAAVATGAWCAAAALDAHAGLAVLALAAALGWVAGFLLVPAPGGLGAREAVFTALLATSLPAATAAAVAVLSRLAYLAVDAIGALAGAAWLTGGRRRRASTGNGPGSSPPAGGG